LSLRSCAMTAIHHLRTGLGHQRNASKLYLHASAAACHSLHLLAILADVRCCLHAELSGCSHVLHCLMFQRLNLLQNMNELEATLLCTHKQCQGWSWSLSSAHSSLHRFGITARGIRSFAFPDMISEVLKHVSCCTDQFKWQSSTSPHQPDCKQQPILFDDLSSTGSSFSPGPVCNGAASVSPAPNAPCI